MSYKSLCAGLKRRRGIRHSPVSAANRRWYHRGHKGKAPTYKGKYAIYSPCWRPKHSRKYIRSTSRKVLAKKCKSAGIRTTVGGKAKKVATLKAELSKKHIKY